MKTNSDWLSYRFNPEKKCQLEIHSIQTIYNVVLGTLREKQQKSHSCLHSQRNKKKIHR